MHIQLQMKNAREITMLSTCKFECTWRVGRRGSTAFDHRGSNQVLVNGKARRSTVPTRARAYTRWRGTVATVVVPFPFVYRAWNVRGCRFEYDAPKRFKKSRRDSTLMGNRPLLCFSKVCTKCWVAPSNESTNQKKRGFQDPGRENSRKTFYAQSYSFKRKFCA